MLLWEPVSFDRHLSGRGQPGEEGAGGDLYSDEC